MNVVGWILQGVLLVVFFFWGYRLGKSSNAEKDNSLCSCNHQYSMHTESGRCNVVKIKKVNYRYQEYRCACVRYDGIPPAHVYMKDV